MTLADLPYPKEMYAALALTNPDYPGSCGRCYEVCDPFLAAHVSLQLNYTASCCAIAE